MNHSDATARSDDDPIPTAPMRMGSEYADAATYLARSPRRPAAAARRKSAEDPQHGSNDSIFGADQLPD